MMTTYIRVNDIKYPATITGKLRDKDWNDRASKAITIGMDYNEAVSLFVGDVHWSIVQEMEELIEETNEDGEIVYVPTIVIEEYDNSEYSIAGDVTDHRNGYVTIKMGKPTAEELLAMLEEVL